MSRAAKAEWERITPMLVEQGADESCAAVLEDYCEAVAMVLTLRGDIKKNGVQRKMRGKDGCEVDYRSPAARDLPKWSMRVQALAAELQITPRSRRRAQASKPKQQGKFAMLKAGSRTA